MNNRILTFNNYNHLKYWFRKIYEYLSSLDLVWRCKVNESIDFGTQRWIFLINDEHYLSGYHNIPIFHSMEYQLEKDFEETMTKILKGEK